ncbi:MAG TPA: hypothetical protein VFA26_19180, partial [Gemmataceae bacterium]|nr:hypothetical protein [Gemmataceae bacterium]
DVAKAPPPRPAAPARRHSFLGAVEFWELLLRTPPWARVLALGVVAVAAASVAANLLLPDDSLPRALCSSLQLAAAMLLLFLAQLWAMFLVAAGDEKLGPKDLFLSFRLWAVTIKRLPETRKPVWLGAWCLTAALCAVFVIGGLGYWGRYYKPKRVATRGIRHAVAIQEAGGTDSLEESVRDAAVQAVKGDPKKGKDKEDALKPDPRPTVECVVIGYLMSPSGQLDGLVLATLKDEKLAYAGVVRRGLTPEAQQELLARLKKLKRDEPLIRGLRLEAIWVKPKIFCEVHHSGPDRDGRLREPNFKGVLE